MPLTTNQTQQVYLARKPNKKSRRSYYPLGSNLLQKLHKLPQSNSILDITMRIDHSFRERDASTEQSPHSPTALRHKPTGIVIKLRLVQRITVDRQLRQRIPGKPDRLNEMRARG